MPKTKDKSDKVKDPVDKDPLKAQMRSYLDDSDHLPKKISAGDIVEGTVVDVRPNSLLVDVGYKSEGVIAGKELKSDLDDVDALKVGDRILVYVVTPEDEEGQLVLSLRRTEAARHWMKLETAKEDNDVVEVVVVESNNGGVICDLCEGIRGFIPTSQLDASRVYANGQRMVGHDISSRVQERLSSLVGEKIKTRIIELDRDKNRIILSEKMVTQARDLEKRENTLRSIKEGDVLEGEVSGITPFGVFVNAQGLEGLVHLSELSWDKVENTGDLYGVGDKVKVQVIGITDGGKRVAYSIKRLQEDPWEEAISKYKIGDIVDGTVQKVVNYGAFVRIGEGLNGLVHISEMSNNLVRNPRDIVKEGEKVKVKILSVSKTERHLGLSLKRV
ncbi:S1 RNA-binding domain-containing protein [Candidatus Dojkabacteria bacterium]|nr:S1 RNA-binding domain-containing protein [Candidatus Dojkabacteria bacterium]